MGHRLASWMVLQYNSLKFNTNNREENKITRIFASAHTMMFATGLRAEKGIVGP